MENISRIEDFLNEFNIEADGEVDGEYYVKQLVDYDEFNEVYNSFENSLKLQRDSGDSYMNDEHAHITYYTDGLLVELVAIFDYDDYTINIAEDD